MSIVHELSSAVKSPPKIIFALVRSRRCIGMNCSPSGIEVIRLLHLCCVLRGGVLNILKSGLPNQVRIDGIKEINGSTLVEGD